MSDSGGKPRPPSPLHPACPSRRLNLSVQYACKPRAGKSSGDSSDGSNATPASAIAALPGRADIRRWARAALDADVPRGGEIVVRFVDEAEGRELNRTYRGKDYATNILSFPYESEPVVRGDLVVCASVVAREAAEQRKTAQAHYAHLIVHGVLHLQGYDHERAADARRMEDKERALLAALGLVFILGTHY